MDNFWKDLKYFKKSEFDCPCCGRNEMTRGFMLMLEKAREIAGIPFIITSGFRCEKHNKEVGGKPTSDHLSGEGADIKVVNSTARELIDSAAAKAGIRRRGIARTFIHLGNCYKNPHPALWLY